jgi:hypothetical protein
VWFYGKNTENLGRFCRGEAGLIVPDAEELQSLFTLENLANLARQNRQNPPFLDGGGVRTEKVRKNIGGFLETRSDKKPDFSAIFSIRECPEIAIFP